MRAFLSLIFVATLTLTGVAAELSIPEKKIVNTVNATVRSASKDYVANQYDSAGKHIRSAIEQINKAVKSGRPELYDALRPAINKVSKAHAMLEFEGVSLPPFVQPTRPTASMAAEKKTTSQSPAFPVTTGSNTPPPNPNAISFTSQVAPILSNRCGRCHIQGNKGQFNLGTFAKLMKGPPEGVVVFAGDTIGSRLIETIETGDMPRGGAKVPPKELALLKGWIMQGAKFDGADPNAAIGTGGAAPQPTANKRPEVKRATGKETVSFSLDVAPLLVKNCTGCHIDAMRNQGGLQMDTFARLLRGGDSGEIVLPGKSAESLLIKKLKGAAGIEGVQMPAGGRPPLAEKEIQLISTWIDEGATLDGSSAEQPIKVMALLAWAAKATPEQMNAKRQELADKNVGLVSASGAPMHMETTDHFRVMGTASPGTIKLVAEKAEAKMESVKNLVRGDTGDKYFRGKATIFVMPRRYDYSEFAKMVEARNIPPTWTSHWKFDGIDAYLAMVATDREEEEDIESRLTSPLLSLAVATRGQGVPRWFAEGAGATLASRNKQDRDQKLQMQAEIAEALAACKDAKAFLGNRLTPVQTDRIGAAMVSFMMDRKNRKNFDNCIRSLSSGTPFESAFAQAFRAPVNTWIDNWLRLAKGY